MRCRAALLALALCTHLHLQSVAAVAAAAPAAVGLAGSSDLVLEGLWSAQEASANPSTSPSRRKLRARGSAGLGFGSRKYWSGGIPKELVALYSRQAALAASAGTAGAAGTAVAAGAKAAARPTANAVTAARASATVGPAQYRQVLGLSYWFYEAQRCGRQPAGKRAAWRGNCHVRDRVPGGWHDAGDHIKHALITAETAMLLSWGVLEFQAGYRQAGQLATAKGSIKWAVDWLAACHISEYQFVGLIGDPAIDHKNWGRPEQQSGPRTVYTWNRTNAASELLGMTSAALASASLMFKPDNATYAAALLARAVKLYKWGAKVQGIYSSSLPGYPDVYGSNRYQDKLMLAAAWLHRATGTSSYLAAAYKHFQDFGGRWQAVPYVSYDSHFVTAVILLLRAGNALGAARVPGHAEYADFFKTTFMQSWVEATGNWGIRTTPLGLRRPEWSKWGNLRSATTVAFMFLLRAKQLPTADRARASAIAFAKSQVDYALGSTGRSFIVGWGNNPPLRAHHRAASCPNLPAPCTSDQLNSPAPNPQILYGALVGGPAGPGDNTYNDTRVDFETNEVAIAYNSGLTGALAGLLELGPK